MLDVARRLEREHHDCRLVICGYRGNGEDFPSNVIAIPFTRNQQELAEYYSLADVTLLTSKRETFSMVTAESLCCGTPLVAFKAGGPESIALEGGALFCDYGDTDTLYQNLVGVLDGEISLDFSADEARKIYSKQTMAEAYEQTYEDIISNR